MLDANNYLGKMLAERYHLIRVIGRSASSIVFYAEDMMIRREDGHAMPVAVKVLDQEASEYAVNAEAFRDEIRAVASIPINPHMVAVLDAAFHEGEHFVVMEYVSGKTLAHYVKEKGGKLPAKEIISIALQLLSALRYAHESGVVHRDIKPQNIMVERADVVGRQVDVPGGQGMPFVKLADFGVALLPDTDLLAVGERGPSAVHYVSPEQSSGAPVGPRSDIYSLGVVMYELATGHVPFEAQSAAGIIAKHQTEMPHHVGEENANIPALLDEVIFLAMQKNPAMRYKDALTMERRLREIFRYLMAGGAQAGSLESPYLGDTLRVSGAGGMSARVMKPTKTQRITEDKPPRAPKPPKPEKAPREPKPIREPKPAKLPKAAKAPKPPKAPKMPKAPKAPREPKVKRERAPINPAKLKLFGLIGGGAVLLAALVVCGAIFLPKLFNLFSGPSTFDVTVPNLVGSVYAESNTYDDGVSVPADKIVYVYHNDFDAGKIISQEPAAGIVMKDVEKVDIILTVSLGPEMMDFSIPEASRTSVSDAKLYLLTNADYSYVQVITERVAAEPVDGVESGTVVGAIRTTLGTEEPLSLDSGKLYKHKVEKIILIYQP